MCARRSFTRAVVLTATCLPIIAALVAGCGSSKPSYCSKLTALETSVKDLKSVNPVKNGTSAVTSAFDKIKTNADAVVNSAKSDFPSETKALNDSVNALATSVKSLSSAPATAIPALPAQIAAAKSAVDGFTSATSSKCG